MGKTTTTKMQTKIQTILFFTFLICVHISFTNSIKIKIQHQQHHRRNNTESIAQIGQPNDRANMHRNQFHVHHITPQNLTDLNNRVRSKFDKAHTKLDEVNDIEKETLEDELFHVLPRKPTGIDSAAIVNLRQGTIPEKSRTFQLQSLQDFAQAINDAQNGKTRSVTVDGNSYKLVKSQETSSTELLLTKEESVSTDISIT